MKNWEDIVKEKLEGYESPLPEGSLAEFRSRRESAGRTAARKRTPLLWIIPTAVAAALAAALFLRKPNGPEDDIDTILPPSVPVVAVAAPEEEKEPDIQIKPVQAINLTAHNSQTQKSEPVRTSGEEEAAAQEELQQAPQQTDAENVRQDAPSDNQETWQPFIPSFPEVESHNAGYAASYDLNVLATVGGALGASLLTALASNIDFASLFAANAEPEGASAMRQAHAQYLKYLDYLEKNGLSMEDATEQTWQDFIGSSIANTDPGTSDTPVHTPAHNENPDKKPETDNRAGTVHHLPLKLGLSVRTPLAERLYLTTGLDYSLYSSTYTYTLSGKHRQQAHYLGIPLRLDWAAISGKRLEIYAGAGVEAEWCLGAKIDGRGLDKDKAAVSLLGAGGVQLHITDRLGLFVEPEISWRMSLNQPTLTTYRSEHPVMFTVATGIRMTLGN